jgi:hypothetical protein
VAVETNVLSMRDFRHCLISGPGVAGAVTKQGAINTLGQLKTEGYHLRTRLISGLLSSNDEDIGKSLFDIYTILSLTELYSPAER